MLSRADVRRARRQADEQLLRTRVEGVPLRDTALILYTSGTTSNPRGAMLSHEAFVRTWMVTAGIWGTPSEDRLWSALPLFHVTALGTVTWVLGKGATFFSDYSFDADRTLATLRDEQDHAVLSRLPAGHRGRARAPGLRQGRPEPDQHLAQRRAAGGAGEVPEAAPARGPADDLRRDGGRLRDADPPRRPARGAPEHVRRVPARARAAGRRRRSASALGPGERGIIQFRGYNTLTGYCKAPEKTAETMLERGWVTMQDLGVLDEEGRVLFLGRVEGDAQGRRRERRAAGDRGAALHPPGGQARAVVGIPDAAPARGRGGVRRAAPGPRGHRGRADRALQGAHRVLQGAAA